MENLIKTVGQLKKAIENIEDETSILVTGLYSTEVNELRVKLIGKECSCDKCNNKHNHKILVLETDLCTG